MPIDIAGIIAILQVIVQELPTAFTTAEEIYSLGSKLFTTINGKEPTSEEVDALEAQIDTDVIEALSPLPPAQPGDPDYGNGS